MTWADLVRPPAAAPPPPPQDASPAAAARGGGAGPSPALRLPADAWGVVLDFCPVLAVCRVGAVCRLLYGVHGRAHVWRRRAAEHEAHVAELCGAGCGLLPDGGGGEQAGDPPAAPGEGAGSLKQRLLRSAFLEARDFDRDLSLRERRAALPAGRAFLSRRLHRLDPRLPGVTLDAVSVAQLRRCGAALGEGGPLAWGDATPSSSASGGGGGGWIGAGRDVSAAALRTVVDHLQEGLAPGAAVDTTAAESGAFLVDVMDALAVDRPTDDVYCGRSLRLLEIRRSECLALVGADGPRWALDVLSTFVVAPQLTRFFTGPELCRGGRVGVIAVDPARLLLLRPPSEP